MSKENISQSVFMGCDWRVWDQARTQLREAFEISLCYANQWKFVDLNKITEFRQIKIIDKRNSKELDKDEFYDLVNVFLNKKAARKLEIHQIVLIVISSVTVAVGITFAIYWKRSYNKKKKSHK